MDLESLAIFVRVAERHSFTQAAEQLGVQKARVSTAIQSLEALLGARLLHRTTRAVRMTPDGELFYARCKELLADADDLRTLFQQAPSALSGRLRIDLPTGVARQFVVPRLGEFLAAHPKVEIELSSTDRQVDLVNEGFDCVLRVGTLRDSGLIARRLGAFRMSNCASPAYLAAHGTPMSLEDLDRHHVVQYAPTLGGKPMGWEYPEGKGWDVRAMRGPVTVNDTQAYQAACVAGLGMIQAPTAGVKPQIEQGLLVEVLPQWPAEPMPVSLLYTDRRHVSKRLQAMMDWLAQVMAPQLAL